MEKNSAVSPVIGSILLVAITVIIVAVIAAFVFGLAGDIPPTRVIAITSDILLNPPTAGDRKIVVTNHGGKDHAAVVGFEIFVDGQLCTLATLGLTVGSFAILDGTSCPGVVLTPANRNHLVVVSHLIDGTSQVLLDTYQ